MRRGNPTTPHQTGETNSAADGREGFGAAKPGSCSCIFSLRLALRVLAAASCPRGRAASGRMAHAAVVAVLAVAVLLACLPPAAAAASSYRGGAALRRRLETMAPMDTAQGLREKAADVNKGVEEDVSTTGIGAESAREVPTGPDPIHHHGRGPRRQSP